MRSMMHDDQVHIDTDIVRGMIVDQFPEYRHGSVEPLRTAGTDTAIFRIGSGITARFPLRAMGPIACAAMLRNEAVAMTEFSGLASLATPRPIGLGRPGPRYPMPWAMQSWSKAKSRRRMGLRLRPCWHATSSLSSGRCAQRIQMAAASMGKAGAAGFPITMTGWRYA
jgi:aminoglycoside phosphotransferase (APT) family kinase protein